MVHFLWQHVTVACVVPVQILGFPEARFDPWDNWQPPSPCVGCALDENSGFVSEIPLRMLVPAQGVGGLELWKNTTAVHFD